ncbi:Hypothetical protein, putative [Bodo saltans]|uniref:Uncharacterized protein n=1 Tax=Bodo saltans TaxID=75058 RepID=A0A0S4J3C3_BODSA|nr:Hypothetical protein, putative [Bodo saltans]|eukprot:CUG85603.1 Hypothetical protein, putative [Bodo saltans]
MNLPLSPLKDASHRSPSLQSPVSAAGAIAASHIARRDGHQLHQHYGQHHHTVVSSSSSSPTATMMSHDHHHHHHQATMRHPFTWESTTPTPLTASELASVSAVYPAVCREVILLLASSSSSSSLHAADTNETLLTRLCERLQLPLVSTTSRALIREISSLTKKSSPGKTTGDERGAKNNKQSSVNSTTITATIGNRGDAQHQQTATVTVLPMEVCLRVLEKLKTLHRLWLFAVYQRARGSGGGGRAPSSSGGGRHQLLPLARRSLVADDVIEALLSLADSTATATDTDEDGLERTIPLSIVLEVLEVFDIANASMREGLALARSDNSPAASPTVQFSASTTTHTNPTTTEEENTTGGPRVRVRDIIEVLLESKSNLGSGDDDEGGSGSTGDVLGDPSEVAQPSTTPEFLLSLVDTSVGCVGGARGGGQNAAKAAVRALQPLASQTSRSAVWEELLQRHANAGRATSSPRPQRTLSSIDASSTTLGGGVAESGGAGGEDATVTPDPRSITPSRSPPPLPPLAMRLRGGSEVVVDGARLPPSVLTAAHFQRGGAEERPWFQLSDVDVPNRTDAHKLLDDGDGSAGGMTRRSHHTARRLTGRLSIRAGSLTPVPTTGAVPSPIKSGTIPANRRSNTPSPVLPASVKQQQSFPEPIGVASHHALQQAEFVRYRTTYKQVRMHQFR